MLQKVGERVDISDNVDFILKRADVTNTQRHKTGAFNWPKFEMMQIFNVDVIDI